MSNFIPSSYQTALLNWVSEGTGNAVVQAVAGSGKTTTIIQMLKRIGNESLLMAFNKKIQLELGARVSKERLNAKPFTVHALCFGVYTKVNGRQVRVEDRKVSNIAAQILSESEAKIYSVTASKLVRLAKDAGFGIEGFSPISDSKAWAELLEHNDLELHEDATLDKLIEVSQKLLTISNTVKTEIDFSDMVYLTMLFGYRLPKFDWVFVDEAQDLSPLRQAVVKSCLKTDGSTRVVVVGDRRQAIYGFSGADAYALDNMKRDHSATEFPLSVCYRCSKAVVTHAQSVNPDIIAHENAPDGSVTKDVPMKKFMENLESLKLTGHDAILCRINAPLTKLAFWLLAKGIACRIEGRDIGQGLINLTYKWARVKTLEQLSKKLSDYEDREFSKALAKKNEAQANLIKDKVACLNACIARCLQLGKNSVDDLKALINGMFSDSDNPNTRKDILTLSSVHKSKGLEWNRVYLLGRGDYMPSPWAKKDWMKEQETNLEYVAITRAKLELIEVEGVKEYLKDQECLDPKN